MRLELEIARPSEVRLLDPGTRALTDVHFGKKWTVNSKNTVELPFPGADGEGGRQHRKQGSLPLLLRGSGSDFI